MKVSKLEAMVDGLSKLTAYLTAMCVIILCYKKVICQLRNNFDIILDDSYK